MSLLPFATLAQLSQMLAAIAQGRTFRLTKGDLTAEVTSNSGETWQENLIQSGSLHKGWAWLLYYYKSYNYVLLLMISDLDKIAFADNMRWYSAITKLRTIAFWKFN